MSGINRVVFGSVVDNASVDQASAMSREDLGQAAVNRAGALYETGLNDASGAAAADWAVVFNQKEGAAAEAERQLALEKERHVDDSAAALQMFENIHRSRPFRA